MHEFRGDAHPVFAVDVLITGGCGAGFIRRMATHGVQVLATKETNPMVAAGLVFRGEPLLAAEPHDSDHSESVSLY